MVQFKCISIGEDVVLIDKSGNIKNINYRMLQELINTHKIEVINLEKDSGKFEIIEDNSYRVNGRDIKALLNRAVALGNDIGSEFILGEGLIHYFYKEADLTLIIPDSIRRINMDMNSLTFITPNIKNVKVIGGKGLRSCKDLFSYITLFELDLTKFNTSNVRDMSQMFENSKIDSLRLGKLDTHRVVSMLRMFAGGTYTTIYLTNLDTSSVQDMREMFKDCRAKDIDMHNIDTSNVIDMAMMFRSCVCEMINLQGLNTTGVDNMEQMFEYCKIDEIDLATFDISNVVSTKRMFAECEARYINLESFNMFNVINSNEMFKGCKSRINAKDSELKLYIREYRV